MVDRSVISGPVLFVFVPAINKEAEFVIDPSKKNHLRVGMKV